MTGLKGDVVHLYPRWVLYRGNGTIICLSRQPLALFAPLFLQWSLFITRTINTKNRRIWCAGWSDTAYGCSKGRLGMMMMAYIGPGEIANSLLRGMGPLSGTFQAQLHWNRHIRAELETCKLWEPYPRSMPKPDRFWPQCPPSAKIQPWLNSGWIQPLRPHISTVVFCLTKSVPWSIIPSCKKLFSLCP